MTMAKRLSSPDSSNGQESDREALQYADPTSNSTAISLVRP